MKNQNVMPFTPYVPAEERVPVQVVPRESVKPGASVWHRGQIWRASANVKNYLYLVRGSVKTRTDAETISLAVW